VYYLRGIDRQKEDQENGFNKTAGRKKIGIHGLLTRHERIDTQIPEEVRSLLLLLEISSWLCF
jgi:hypothetical protein